MVAVRRSSRAPVPTTGASKRGLRREMPEAPTRPNHELRDRAHRPPVLPRPPVRRRVGTDLRRTSRGNPGGRRARSRACVQLGRPRLVRGASQPHLQRGPHGGLVHNQRSSCPQCTAARLSTPVSARGRGERVRGTARERAVACGASAHTRPSANPNQGVQGRGVWTGHPAGGRLACARLTSATCTAGGKAADDAIHGHDGHHGHP